ncbi:DUF2867 domain-containing protein [Arcobacter sp. L]|uniref:DUF2867 domain-containing protein n=1 Tax=Arcobacter sp. L TaxID=944547 RepID=UPI00022961D5|nr:DUF2867 domain-containing protein [Arcobacter sp. L]BAK73573.1 conserved hypothetical protein [Arcobacter sp. L]
MISDKILTSSLPSSSNINSFISKIDFSDSYEIRLKKDDDIKNIYLKFLLNSPKLVKYLMLLRNKIMSLFGFKTEIINSNNIKDIQLGNKVGFFNIYFINEHEIIAGEEDKHLDFLVSFYKRDTTLIVTTLVKYNNIFGKIYMTFVKPFHKIVVKNMLKNLK